MGFILPLGVNEWIGREKGFPTCVILVRGRAVEGSVWDFVRGVSRSWESACNLLPILRENGGKLGLEEGEEDQEATRSEFDGVVVGAKC